MRKIIRHMRKKSFVAAALAAAAIIIAPAQSQQQQQPPAPAPTVRVNPIETAADFVRIHNEG